MAESVWDYPRPPRVEPMGRPVRIELGGRVVAASASALRVLETSHPPTIYVPFDDFAAGALRDADGRSLCEWKGVARYHDLVASPGAPRVGDVPALPREDAGAPPRPRPGERTPAVEDAVDADAPSDGGAPGRPDRGDLDRGDAHTVVRERAAWSYPEPTPRFAELRGHACVYPSAADACFIGDERVAAQQGDFYGGWITRDLEGPFKGGPGTWGW